jgi:hypothetical protein
MGERNIALAVEELRVNEAKTIPLVHLKGSFNQVRVRDLQFFEPPETIRKIHNIALKDSRGKKAEEFNIMPLSHVLASDSCFFPHQRKIYSGQGQVHKVSCAEEEERGRNKGEKVRAVSTSMKSFV